MASVVLVWKTIRVRRKLGKYDGRQDSSRKAALEVDVPGSNLAAVAAESLRADKELAQHCVAGEVAAWEALHSQCHDSLVASVRVLLSGRSNDANVAEEIAGQVWYALVANDGELLTRYDPNRGARLITFMRAIARDIISRHFRSERRRTIREIEASRARPQLHAADLDHIDISLAEFLGTLTQSDRQFCGDCLLGPPEAANDESTADYSRTTFWQKTHRIYDKFVQFLGHDV